MSNPDILAAMKEVEGQILSWNQNIRESMKYIESRFADLQICGSIKPHFLHLKPQFSSQTAAATIPNSSLSPPLPFNSPPPLPQNNPAPPKQTSSQSSFEELIKKIEAKIAANAITPPPQPEPSGDTQVVTTATSVTIFQEEQLAAKIVDVSNNPCETKRIVYAPEIRVVRYVHKVFDELTEMDSSSPEEVAASGALRKNSYSFIEEKKAGDSSTDKIGHISIQRELSLAGGEKIQVYMNEKWANLHIAPAATLTDYFKKKGTETLRVFDPGGSAFDARVREAAAVARIMQLLLQIMAENSNSTMYIGNLDERVSDRVLIFAGFKEAKACFLQKRKKLNCPWKSLKWLEAFASKEL